MPPLRIGYTAHVGTGDITDEQPLGLRRPGAGVFRHWFHAGPGGTAHKGTTT